MGRFYRRTSYGWLANLRSKVAEIALANRRLDLDSCDSVSLAVRVSGRINETRRGRPLAFFMRVETPKRIVYVLKNSANPPYYYTGVTSDLRTRLHAHNAGRCLHTAKHRPWAVDVVVKFADERRAISFEKYLKSGSGVEFARRHLR